MVIDKDIVNEERLKAVAKLIGLDWDHLLQWLLVVYAGCWFCWGWVASYPDPQSPFAWGLKVAADLGLPTNVLATDLAYWRTTVAPEWFPIAVIGAAAILAASLARSPDPGRVALTTAAILSAIELTGDLGMTLVWVTALATAPAIVSLMIYVARRTRGFEPDELAHDPGLTLTRLAFGPLSPILLTVAAPFLLVRHLIEQYGFVNHRSNPTGATLL